MVEQLDEKENMVEDLQETLLTSNEQGDLFIYLKSISKQIKHR